MGPEKSFLERRGRSRTPVRIPVQFQQVEDPAELEKLRAQPALAKDLSLDGMYIKTAMGMKPGDVFRLDISIPEKSKGQLFAFAEVAWANPEGAGLRLLLMADEDRESLKAYLEKLSSG